MKHAVKFNLYFSVFVIFSFIPSVITGQNLSDKNSINLADAKTVQEVMQLSQKEFQKLVSEPSGTSPNYEVAENFLLETSKRINELAQSDDDKAYAAMAKYQGYKLITQHLSKQGKDISECEKQLAAAFADMEKYPKSALAVQRQKFKSFQDKVWQMARLSNIDDNTFDSIIKETQQWAATFKNDEKQVVEPYLFINDVFWDKPDARKKIAEQWTLFIDSDVMKDVPAHIREAARKIVGAVERRRVGFDPKLYGRTFDNKPFQWDSLRGKVVVVVFTASWCGPCKSILPKLKEYYEKYHQDGFEIVSVYVWDNLDASKKDVEKLSIPWITISEELTEKAGEPKQSIDFGIRGVPTTLLIDKTGKIIIDNSVWNHLGKLPELLKQ
ncbi:MAG: TlpA family protein disulfide reductase [Planctomycetaceae bacterium]|nr:TlpA family protein disulfide reductase [Planctomycetaceae bacterium]